MRKRTYDIIAKFISEEHGIRVVFRSDIKGPRILLETKTIELPENIQDQNALAALSSLIHEAAHMKYTVELPKDLAKDNIEHEILNAMEDVRIDRKNFRVLPNIYSFYEKFVKEHVCTEKNKESLRKQHMFVRCIIALILTNTSFGKYVWDGEAVEYLDNNGLWSLFSEGIMHIDCKNWDEVKRCIKEIKSKFQFKKEKEKKNEKSNNEGKKGNKQTGSKSPEHSNNDARKGIKQDNRKENDSKPEDGIKSPESFIRPATCWNTGSGLKGPGPSGMEFSPIQLTETTRKKFIEALNTKEKVRLQSGPQLNTDNLVAFFTGQIDELFKDETTEKVKKSKIVFCLDASGSMSAWLMDNTSRRRTLAKSVSSLTEILDELRETEGLNIDYDIVAFASRVYRLNKKNWQGQYLTISGGTDIVGAIDESIKILNNEEIDGNKIIILVTDGDVHSDRVARVQDMIMKHNSDIKAMLIGIGAKVNAGFVKNICGDNNILCLEHADQILMEAIQTMLEE